VASKGTGKMSNNQVAIIIKYGKGEGSNSSGENENYVSLRGWGDIKGNGITLSYTS